MGKQGMQLSAGLRQGLSCAQSAGQLLALQHSPAEAPEIAPVKMGLNHH